MSETRSEIEGGLLRLLFADIGYSSGGDKRFMLDLGDKMGEYFGSTKRYTVYRHPSTGRYNIYMKGSKSHPVSVNLTSIDSVADWLIDAEKSDVPVSDYEEDVISLESPLDVHQRWKEFQEEKKVRKTHPLREIGFVEPPPYKAQYVGGTLFREDVPFEKQTAIWRQKPGKGTYEIRTVYEHTPTWKHETESKGKLSEEELRKIITHPERVGVDYSWGYQPEISFRNPETGEYEFVRYTPVGEEEEKLLPRKFTEPSSGWGILPTEESTLAKWSSPETPENIMAYEQRKHERLEEYVPTPDLYPEEIIEQPPKRRRK